MSKDKYVHEKLTLPSEMPLFNYNINFEGLNRLLEGVNVKVNQNEELIHQLQEGLQSKLPTHIHQQTEKKLNSSYSFGTTCQHYIDKAEAETFKINKTELKDLPQVDQYCWKNNRLAQMVEYLMDKCQKHEDRLNNDNKRHQKLIEESFRRLEDKLNGGTESLTKTINSYFTQSTSTVSKLDSQLNTLKKQHGSKLQDLNNLMNKRVSQGSLKASLEAAETKIKNDLEAMLKNDHMQRLGTVNQLKQSFKDVEKDIDLKNKVSYNKMNQLTQKVSKALQMNVFDIEKHKIYQRLSEVKNKTDALERRNNQFLQFRKSYLGNNQKQKQEMIGLTEELAKMQGKESSFKKLENMSDVVSSLNPHLICQVQEQVKLHQAEIGKLQQQLINLETENRNIKDEKPMPEVNGGQNADLVQKIVKEFMNNLDFEGRMKRSERELQDMKRRSDGFSELEKKMHILSKEVDMGAILKQLKKKCDEENTRKDTRILDGKVEQLFEFYKQLRREVEERRKTNPRQQPMQNYSLTTKRLHSANCISCTPSTHSTTRKQLGKSRMQMSLDYSLEGQKNTIFTRLGK